MPDEVSPESVPQVPGASASNPFPKMTREEQVRVVVKGKGKFPKKTFAVIVLILAVAAGITYVLYKNQHSQFQNINDVENPKISISQPQNGDTLKGQSSVVVYLSDNTINQKTYKSTHSNISVSATQSESLSINVSDDLTKASNAQLLYESTGIINQDECQVSINSANTENCGPTYVSDQQTQKQTYNVPISSLKTGDNTFNFTASSGGGFTINSAILVVTFGDISKTGKVVKVDFLLDDKQIGEKTDFTLPFNLDTTKFSNGPHVLVAEAFDEVGNASYSAPRTITIQN